jgi:hypothetical protein
MDFVTDLEFTVPDLVQGKEYLFKVCARNKCGPGEPAYVDEPVNMSAPASKHMHLLPHHILTLVFLRGVDIVAKERVDNMEIT